MKSILVYGDSNTWGYVPGTGERYAWSIRWPGVAQLELGSDFKVIEEGLSGRTTSWEDPTEDNRSGRLFLPIVLETHSPLDLVVLALGTNDLKACFGLSPFDIARGAATLVELTQSLEPTPQVLLVSPAHIRENSNCLEFEGGQIKSEQLAQYYCQVAENTNCYFMDATQVVVKCGVDGVHWESDSHQDFGLRIAKEIREIFEET